MDGRHHSSMKGSSEASDVAERHSTKLRCVLEAMLGSGPAVVVLYFVISKQWRIHIKKILRETEQI